MSGRCANSGTLAPSARKSRTCLGVFERWSLAPDDVRDGHGRVIDADREVVERRAVGADDDQVTTEGAGVDGDVAPDQVVEVDPAVADPEPDDGRRVVGPALASLLGCQVGAPPDVVGGLVSRLLGRAVGRELVGGAEALVCLVLGEEPLHGLAVAAQTLHLAIWPVRAALAQVADGGSLVPVDAQPLEPVEDVPLEADRGASHVRVLQPQDERAPMSTSEQVVEQRGARGPDVQRPGRAGGDPTADGHARKCARGTSRSGWSPYASRSPRAGAEAPRAGAASGAQLPPRSFLRRAMRPALPAASTGCDGTVGGGVAGGRGPGGCIVARRASASASLRASAPVTTWVPRYRNAPPRGRSTSSFRK